MYTKKKKLNSLGYIIKLIRKNEYANLRIFAHILYLFLLWMKQFEEKFPLQTKIHDRARSFRGILRKHAISKLVAR